MTGARTRRVLRAEGAGGGVCDEALSTVIYGAQDRRVHKCSIARLRLELRSRYFIASLLKLDPGSITGLVGSWVNVPDLVLYITLLFAVNGSGLQVKFYYLSVVLTQFVTSIVSSGNLCC